MEKARLETWQPIPTDCHHPGYQSLSARSWWCDACMSDCFDDCVREYQCNELASPFWENVKSGAAMAWENFQADCLEFWQWFKPVCMFLVGGVLSAVFIIVAYYMRGQSPRPELSPDFEEAIKTNYLGASTVRSNRLYFIEVWRDKLHQAKAAGDWDAVKDLEEILASHYSDLDKAEAELDDIDRNYPEVGVHGRPWTRHAFSMSQKEQPQPSFPSTFLPVSMLSMNDH